jgi:hypothetical protein
MKLDGLQLTTPTIESYRLRVGFIFEKEIVELFSSTTKAPSKQEFSEKPKEMQAYLESISSQPSENISQARELPTEQTTAKKEELSPQEKTLQNLFGKFRQNTEFKVSVVKDEKNNPTFKIRRSIANSEDLSVNMRSIPVSDLITDGELSAKPLLTLNPLKKVDLNQKRCEILRTKLIGLNKGFLVHVPHVPEEA